MAVSGQSQRLLILTLAGLALAGCADGICGSRTCSPIRDACPSIHPAADVLVCNQNLPREAVTDGRNIYWTTSEGLMAAELGDSEGAVLSPYGGGGLSADDRGVCWGVAYGVKCFDPVQDEVYQAIAPTEYVDALAVAGDTVYWGSSRQALIGHAPRRGAVVAAIAPASPTRLALDDERIYFTTTSTAGVTAVRVLGRVVHTLETVWSTTDDVRAIAPRPGGVLVATEHCEQIDRCRPISLPCCAGRVHSIELSSRTEEVIFSVGEGTVFSLAVDGGDALIATHRSVVAVPLAGGPPRMLLDEAGMPRSLTVRDGFLYLVDPRILSDAVFPEGLVLRLRL